MNTIMRVFHAFVLTVLLAACGAGATPAIPTPTLETVATEMPTVTANPTATGMPIEASVDSFNVSVAHYIIESAGFQDIIGALTEIRKIDTTALSKVNRVRKVLAHTTWPWELDVQAEALVKFAGDFAAALETESVEDAARQASPFDKAQHNLSSVTSEWLATVKPGTTVADPFKISVAQYFMDTAGFHSIAEALTETKKIDTTALSKVDGVRKVLAQTVWPTELNEQAQAFIKSLGDFAAALEAESVEDATKLAEPVHEAQHDLSHALDEWLATAKPVSTESDPFNVHVAQYLMDGAGFHGIADALTETKKIDATALSTVNRVKKVLVQTVWPTELNEQAQAFIKTLGDLAVALEAENVEDSTKNADIVHDAQHELSHAIDGSDEDGQDH